MKTSTPTALADLVAELRPADPTRPTVKLTLGQIPTVAATLTEQLGSGASLVIPDVAQRVFSPLPRGTVASLLQPVPITTGNSCYVFTETTTPQTGKDAVPEGEAIPESEITFANGLEPVRTCGALLPITGEILEDGPGFENFLRRRLVAEVDIDEDRQLLAGTGNTDTGQVIGFLYRSGLQTPVDRGAMTNLDTILAQRKAIAAAVNEEPDGVVMHPRAWTVIEGLRDAQGAYVVDPTLPANQRALFGMRVVLTRALPSASVALVGCFGIGGAVLQKGGTTIEISGSHSDWFVRGLYGMRGTRRVGLAVTLPGGFGWCTGLDS